MKDNRLELSFLNFEQKGMKLMVYDNVSNDLLYEENLKPDFVVNKVYDFSKLRNGQYKAGLIIK